MAGDWIKMRGNLWDDPRVSRLCDLLDCGEAPVIGGLYWLWNTADQHTESGILSQLTLRQIDRKVGVPGFGAALASIGWVIEREDGIEITRFEEHNGSSAKKRAVTAKRVANHRGNADVTPTALQDDDGDVTDALAREREEKEKNSSSLRSEEKSRKRGEKFVPDDFTVTAEMQAWAAESAPLADVSRETAAFRDWEFARARTDWIKTWRTWMRKASEDAAKKGLRRTSPASEPEWRTEQRTRTQQAAPGVAAGRPASEFFIDVDARAVDVPALTGASQ